jgi:dinuclear metal center YbgI/SA1388 family protein
MVAKLNDIVECADALLQPQLFQDYCPNGLQVQGSREVATVVSGVTASQALIARAIELGADALLVHHGYFWKNEDPRVVGMKRNRLSMLLANDISLLAYHLPLDAHPVVGNNAQLAARLGITVTGGLQQQERPIGNVGHFEQALGLDDLALLISRQLQREPLIIAASERPVKRLAWCTGAAQDYIEQAAALGVDAFISGEISEPTAHIARELGLHYIAAGHHATERYGVQALGGYLAEQLAIKHLFVDIDNPA